MTIIDTFTVTVAAATLDDSDAVILAAIVDSVRDDFLARLTAAGLVVAVDTGGAVAVV